ncbi:hypothetical protein K431DRAFT_283393 [Polychaeton citri CBS 116435]|uniref:Required for respiratory growth protein 7, mitochondrial n=1 Tax=Polychaeton citri CBS 116435 TaxID=1314669 RepID=A0A9P4Q951_9PEZI|nr:hypothetical protein K431DRAFT_283393 [Polychaeton citri CBS 116435]
MPNFGLARLRSFGQSSKLQRHDISLSTSEDRKSQAFRVESSRLESQPNQAEPSKVASKKKRSPRLKIGGTHTPVRFEENPECKRQAQDKHKGSPASATLEAPRGNNHHDLASFLTYADATGLNKNSTVFRGTLYEYTVLETLRNFSFELTHCGRSHDLGVDLIGFWHLPSDEHAPSRELRVLVQCKAETLKPGHVRELAGSYDGAPAGWKGDNVVSLLVTSGEVTRGVREALQRSSIPAGVLGVDIDGYLQQVLWNVAAEQRGLTGIGVIVKYADKAHVTGSRTNGLKGSIALTWLGRPWPKSKARTRQM